MLKRVSFFIALVFVCNLLFAQTKVQKTELGYTLLRNGKPYYIKGVGGQINFDKMQEIGANSFRTWGPENAQTILDEAQKRGLTVMLGLWLQTERQGFDYNNKEKVKAQLDYLKTVVDKYKNHPALLFWGIGNELDLFYTNPDVWYAVQDVAKYIHEVDTNHPTSTVTAGLDSLEVKYIMQRCPDIDIYGINTYADIADVPKYIASYGWKKPYVITEWGPTGHWESPNTSWKVAFEQTSTEKREVYAKRYKNDIAAHSDYCIGSYAFAWGHKQEYTETWYGLFSKENLPTETIDALEEAFTGKEINNQAISIRKVTIDQKVDRDNISVKAEEIYDAVVETYFRNELSSKSKITYKWRVLEESTDKKAGGDVEKAAAEINTSIKHGNSNEIKFRAPRNPGQYRLFVSIYSNGKVSYANMPFLVTPRGNEEKQARFMQLKQTDMSSFKQ